MGLEREEMSKRGNFKKDIFIYAKLRFVCIVKWLEVHVFCPLVNTSCVSCI